MNQPTQTTEEEARSLGGKAASMLLAFALNPFPDGSANATAWAAGWNAEAAKAAHYADAMIKLDRERPQWARDFATGARDPNINRRGGQ